MILGKSYLGSTEIQKVYLGNSVVYELSGGGIPIIESHATTTQLAAAGTVITATAPSGITSGDLLVIGCCVDETSWPSDLWDDVTNKPTGFTLLGQTGFGTGEQDAQLGIFYKVADGTEGATIDVPNISADDNVTFYLRISGASSPALIGNFVNVNAASVGVTGVTTTVDNALALFFTSADGGDMFPFSISGTGWAKIDEAQASVGSTTSSGVFGSKDMALAGATGTVTVTPSLADGMSGVQVIIKSI